jgi:uncharacterized membrane protein YphA (DoxX/SURF4 family)
MNRIFNFFILLCRLLVGAVFVFSGFVKAVDPMGFAYKLTEYFEAFGIHFLIPFALIFAVLLSVAELTMGLCLLMNICMEAASWAVVLFMSFFTLLTLILALTNPVSDCGCFGDAIKLTNWQTFFKNLILLPISLLIFKQRRKLSRYAQPVKEWAYAIALFTAAAAISFHCARHLPLVDFLPFRMGQDIPAAMTAPADAPANKYNITLVYEKNGQRQEFTADSAPWQDSTWKYVETHSVLVTRGYVPPIADFAIEHPSLGNISDSLLSSQWAVLVVLQKVEAGSNKYVDALRTFVQAAVDGGATVAALTSSPLDVARTFAQKHNLPLEFCAADYTTLKTTRLNPGVLLLHYGIIAGKWSIQDLPSGAMFAESPLAASIRMEQKRSDKMVYIAGIFLVLLVCSVYGNIRRQRRLY